MTDQEKLFLIVLTDHAINRMAECEISDEDIQDELDELSDSDNLRLFHYKTGRDKKEGDAGRAALPLAGSESVLLLKIDDQSRCFLAVDFWGNTKTNGADPNNYDLPNSVTAQIIEGHAVDSYLKDAIDHDSIWSEVCDLAPWRPYESTNIEEQKWIKYLGLYQKIIEDRKVNFSIFDIKLDAKKISGTVAEASDKKLIEKIKVAKGEEVTSAEQKLGTLKDIINSRVTIEKRKWALKTPSEGSLIEIDGESFQVERLDNSQNENMQTIEFKYKGFEFTAQGIHQKQEKPQQQQQNARGQSDEDEEDSDDDSQEDSVKIININIDSIVPQPIQCSIDFIGDEYQVKVMEKCFEKVKNLPIWQVLSGDRVSKLPSEQTIDLDNTKLNEEQKKAVQGAIGAEELFLIWGPPGTGKTEVIKEIAKQENLLGRKVLITSQTNTAVDNALARLFDAASSYPFRIAKEGYELEGEDASKVPFIDTSPKFYLDFLERNINTAANFSNDGQCRHIRRQFQQAIAKSKRIIKKSDKSDTELREFKQLAELYRRKINVVGATLMESGKRIWIEKEKKRKNKLCNTTGIAKFDTIIIDEVSKATPPELFIPLPLGKKLILVGDHKQLPPMFEILSGGDLTLEQWAENAGIPVDELDPDNTIFERLWKRHIGDASKCRAMLTKQYRMHPDIEAIIQPFYNDEEGNLSCGLSEEGISALSIDHGFFRPTLWIGTRRDIMEKRDGTSFFNEDEIEKVGKLLDKLAEVADKEMSVGIITFYGAQLRKLRNKYERKYAKKFGELVFGTVDRFQGRECDVIICSLVRNNKHRNIGFASKTNRINVAFSRARKSLIILGSKELFAYAARDKPAQGIYNAIYKLCHKPKPKELE